MFLTVTYSDPSMSEQRRAWVAEIVGHAPVSQHWSNGTASMRFAVLPDEEAAFVAYQITQQVPGSRVYLDRYA